MSLPVRETKEAPTVEEMDELGEGQYILWTHNDSRLICVRCYRVDKVHVVFTCPFCWTMYRKNGQPYLRAQRVKHLHGSGGNLKVRSEKPRVRFCPIERFPIKCGQFQIYVTPTTKNAVPIKAMNNL